MAMRIREEKENAYAVRTPDGYLGIQFLLDSLFCREVGILGSQDVPIVGSYKTVPLYLQQ